MRLADESKVSVYETKGDGRRCTYAKSFCCRLANAGLCDYKKKKKKKKKSVESVSLGDMRHAWERPPLLAGIYVLGLP